jgi:PKD repeat protein
MCVIHVVKTNYIHIISHITADFVADPLTGSVPLYVQFTDTSQNAFQYWRWDFDGNGTIDSTNQHPRHKYSFTGTYTVTLLVSNNFGSEGVLYDSITRTNYIHATAYEPVIDFTAQVTRVTIGIPVMLFDISPQSADRREWQFGTDGYGNITSQTPSVAYYSPGLKTVRLDTWIMNDHYTETKTDYIDVTDPYGPTPIHYVSLTGNHMYPFESITKGSTNIALAVYVAEAGDTVIVDAGYYKLNKTLDVSESVKIKSIKGPEYTILDIEKKDRCVKLGANSCIEGFTIKNGCLIGRYFNRGAGICCSISNNIERCVITDNIIKSSGDDTGYGAGVYGGSVRNSIISFNKIIRTWSWGYGYGPGAYGSILINCTIHNNTGISLDPDWGGAPEDGICNCSCINCVVFSNVYDIIKGWGRNYTNHFTYSCTDQAFSGEGNITADPLFINPAEGDFRLQEGSPCIDAGTNMAWMYTAYDLAGQARIQDGIVDMGAYEYIPEPGLYGLFSILLILNKKLLSSCTSAAEKL